MAEYNYSFKGVLVYTAPKAEIHQYLGFYTEEGMVYVTAYGARKSKNLHKRTLSVFTMGKVFVMKTKRNMYTFKDIEVYRNGERLGDNLLLYYSACVCVELVRYLVGSDHYVQFKLLVDVLLYLTDLNTVQWKESLAFFLWQSLANNGWQPDFSKLSIGQCSNNDNKNGFQKQWVLYQNGKIDSFINSNDVSFNSRDTCVLPFSLVFLLRTISQLSPRMAIESFSHIHSQSLSQFVRFLIHQWMYLLGKKLLSISFLQRYL